MSNNPSFEITTGQKSNVTALGPVWGEVIVHYSEDFNLGFLGSLGLKSVPIDRYSEIRDGWKITERRDILEKIELEVKRQCPEARGVFNLTLETKREDGSKGNGGSTTGIHQTIKCNFQGDAFTL